MTDAPTTPAPGQLFTADTPAERLTRELARFHEAHALSEVKPWHAPLHAGDVEAILAQLRTVGLLAQVSPGTLATAAERNRQMVDEGYDPMDDMGKGADLAKAAAAYLRAVARMLEGGGAPEEPITPWPWDAEYWKLEGPLRTSVKAAALAVAAVDALLADVPQDTQPMEPVPSGD